jgi:toxin CcdB
VEVVMPQFAVYLNKNLASHQRFPLLVDVQSELLEELETRVVIPIASASGFNDFPLRDVMPTLKLDGKEYLLMTPQLTAVPRRALGPMRGSVAAHARAISIALDMLLRGFAGGP